MSPPLDPEQDYPLAEHHPEWLRTPSGLSLDALTLEAVLAGKVPADDLRITPEALMLQAEVAVGAGRPHLARNFRRAAELTHLPDALVLLIYTALRPYRSTWSELEEIAGKLENEHGALENAGLVREAAEVYRRRGLLRPE
jgi:propanediol dehydratase small subunit